MRSQNAGLGLKGSSYGANSSDTYRDKLKKLVCFTFTLQFISLLKISMKYVSSGATSENLRVIQGKDPVYSQYFALGMEGLR